ncbi:hypothetical protein DFH07DRAFT_322467 [Mycena maculata]|uniref:Glutaredoxin domain-containing protein n=1 Tax=Mycena maculata TaxID=230809 RepID=A0AAD7KBG0_9AGAR|nr:hypothetical protein DFH07DRAFT_322467 [Mycena maculata]
MTFPNASSRTPLRSQASSHHRSTSSISLPFTVMSGLNPKRNRHRTTFLALLALLSLSAYVFCSQFPVSLSPVYRVHKDTLATDQAALAVEATWHSRLEAAKKHKSYAGRKPITLTPAQELAAVSSFLASLPQNVIPLSVDPSLPIDPELVLDFDTRSPHAMEEVERVVDDVWSQNPVMLYSKLYSPASREIKSILMDMNLRPPPLIIDVDARDDVDVLTPMLTRLTASPDLPILLIGGQPMGSIAQIRDLLASGDLKSLIKSSGAVIGGGKRRKHRK